MIKSLKNCFADNILLKKKKKKIQVKVKFENKENEVIKEMFSTKHLRVQSCDNKLANRNFII